MQNFVKETQQGYKIIGIYYADDRRRHAIIKRTHDYAVAVGYNVMDGTWAQGVYGFQTAKEAKAHLSEKYTIVGKCVKLKNLRKAVGDYQTCNKGGIYSPRYGVLMLDPETGELWCDEFYSLGHNSFSVYHSPVVYLSKRINEIDGCYVDMKGVKNFVNANYPNIIA